eukprot:m.73898 g.73898  ORF g.73898 m.73898 type:complete len:249 (+) comp14486_c0_seq1:119-865(+)
MDTSASAAGASSLPKIDLDTWTSKLDDVPVNRSQLNKLIMDYLVVEGYKDAAEHFQNESGEPTPVNLDAVQSRMKVRGAVQSGDVQTAIDLVNDLNPEILDTNSRLYFHLNLQRLIELIRGGNIEQAMEFAQAELAPLGEEHAAFLPELEEVMALLVFSDRLDSKSPLGHLLDATHRQNVASELNAAILASQSQEREPRLPSLLKFLVWMQAKLSGHVRFPNMDLHARLQPVADENAGGAGGSTQMEA